MNIDQTDPYRIVMTDVDNKFVSFTKHAYLPQYRVAVILGVGNGNMAGIKFVQEAVEWMFLNTDCLYLIGDTLVTDRAARAFAARVPWRYLHSDEHLQYFDCGIQYWMDKRKPARLPVAKITRRKIQEAAKNDG